MSKRIEAMVYLGDLQAERPEIWRFQWKKKKERDEFHRSRNNSLWD